MTQLTPYLEFNGNCREAMTFYQACLGGELFIQTYAEAPMEGELPAELRDRIIHSQLSGGGLILMAADMMGAGEVSPSKRVTLCLNSGSREEIKGYFEKLSEGATVSQPVQEAFFGMYGSLTDKFGIAWMVQAN
jgi:PhnB protein